MIVNLYLFLDVVYLNLSREVQDQDFRCVNGRPEFVINRPGAEVKKFLISPGRTRVFREVPMNRFSTAVSGAQLSEKVTLKHAHSSGCAHPTATFDSSIHTSIERPTRWYQHKKKSPRFACDGGASKIGGVPESLS